MFSPIWGKGNGRGISGFAVNRARLIGVLLYKVYITFVRAPVPLFTDHIMQCDMFIISSTHSSKTSILLSSYFKHTTSY